MALFPRLATAGYSLGKDHAQVLLFHGFTGSPYDLRPVAHYLYNLGFFVRVPLLLGHGTTVADLSQVKKEEWLSLGRFEIAQLDESRPIILGGLSMGALIALILADACPRLDALILLSPALRLNFLADCTVAAVHQGLLKKSASIKKLSGGSDILDPKAKAACPSYKEMPIEALLEFAALLKPAENAFSLIKAPIFYAFGLLDGAIDIKKSRNIIIEKSASFISGKIYSNSKHVISLDYDKENLCTDLGLFLHTVPGVFS